MAWADKVDEAKEKPKNPSRRNFLKLAGGGAMAAAFPELNAAVNPFATPTAENPLVNSLVSLGEFEFLGNNGEIIQGSKLKEKIGNNPFTISFGFNGCEAFCPFGTSAIGMVAKEFNHNIKHIVINVKPWIDGLDSVRSNYLHSLTHNHNSSPTGVNEDNVIVLYPKVKGKNISDTEQKKIIEATQNVVSSVMKRTDGTPFPTGFDRKNPAIHSPDVVLYNSQGEWKDQQSSLEFDDKIAQRFKANLTQGQGVAY